MFTGFRGSIALSMKSDPFGNAPAKASEQKSSQPPSKSQQSKTLNKKPASNLVAKKPEESMEDKLAKLREKFKR